MTATTPDLSHAETAQDSAGAVEPGPPSALTLTAGPLGSCRSVQRLGENAVSGIAARLTGNKPVALNPFWAVSTEATRGHTC